MSKEKTTKKGTRFLWRYTIRKYLTDIGKYQLVFEEIIIILIGFFIKMIIVPFFH